jgi:hypothetical protein
MATKKPKKPRAAKAPKAPKEPKAARVQQATTELAVATHEPSADGSALWAVYAPRAKHATNLCPIADKEEERGVSDKNPGWRKAQLISRPATGDKLPQVGDGEYRGPYLRLCMEQDKPGVVVRVASPKAAIELGRQYRECEGTAKFCAEKVGASVPSALGGLGRGFLRRRRG